MNARGKNIGVVSCFGGPEGGETFLSDLVKILSSISDNTYVIATNTSQRDRDNICFYVVKYEIGENILAQASNQVSLQLKMSYKLARLGRKVNLWVFFGGEGLLLPMLTAKLFRGKVALLLAGYLEKEGEFNRNVLYRPLTLFKRVNCTLSNKIIIYSERLIEQWHLEKYRNKILVADRHFLNFSTFKLEKPLGKRDKIVGYIGSLSEHKGIRNFLEAIPRVLERENNVRFLIAGDGGLRKEIEQYLSKASLEDKVNLVGWVPHDKISGYLNELYLLVLPSYTEGVPNIILEAMACGTPVLATLVGAIPDFIKDGETGFIISNASPLYLANDIERALNHPSLARIASNAKKLVEREFSYKAAVERYNRIINDFS